MNVGLEKVIVMKRRRRFSRKCSPDAMHAAGFQWMKRSARYHGSLTTLAEIPVGTFYSNCGEVMPAKEELQIISSRNNHNCPPEIPVDLPVGFTGSF